MANTRATINLGKRFNRKIGFPSEPHFVRQMQATVKELTHYLEVVLVHFEDVSEEIMIDALQPTKELAQHYTPILTGDLVNSAYLAPVSTARSPRVELGFAKGGKPHYAVYVHEMTTHYHEAPTQAKFLQRAVMEDLDYIFFRLQAGYGAVLRRL